MRKTVQNSLLVCSFAFLLACSQVGDLPESGRTPAFEPAAASVGFSETTFGEEIRQKFEDDVKGFSVVLANSDGIQAKVSGGYAQAPGDGDVLMKTFVSSGIGSVKKVMSGVALLHLFENGQLADTSVQAQLDMTIWGNLPPKWQDTYSGNVENITYRQLLQHKSGFRIGSNGQPGFPASTKGRQLQYLIAQDVKSEDLGVREYNNSNITILLLLIPAIAYPDEAQAIHEAHEDRTSSSTPRR